MDRRRCIHCGEQIVPADTPSGWTHWPGAPNRGYAGPQCAGMPYMATPPPAVAPIAPPFVGEEALRPPP